MDSLTQIALGGVVGALVAGKKYGRKSVLIGAICGTIPDMDVLIPMGDPISDMTYHRGFSHSFLFAMIVTPILAALFTAIKWFSVKYKNYKLHLLIFLTLATHILLDSMTIYGTQLFWPLSSSPVSIGSIFIIDLLYTLPLLISMFWFLRKPDSHKVIKAGVIISSLYLLWSFSIQSHVEKIARQNIVDPNAQILVLTTPFNTLLWRVIHIEESGYSIGYYSIFDKSKEIAFVHYKSRNDLLESVGAHKGVERFRWFNRGAFLVSQRGQEIVISDIRMGREPDSYMFSFVVGEVRDGNVISVPNRRYSRDRPSLSLRGMWERIWNEDLLI